MSEPVPLTEGTVLAGKLRIVRLLGMGGMGAVYEVEHAFTKHRRALKLLHAEMLQHPMVVARFLREASAAGHIGNVHIVETFDAGTLESGEPYIVMEMLQGETLASRLEKQRRLSLGEIVDLVRQACDGVQAAHDAGIVHRDLKPENLFVVDKGGRPFVKILDFGISKFDRALTGGQGTTKEGSSLGTPYYMSPEQVDGDRDLDARTDVYALGVILYECASGKKPFRADALPKLAVLIHEGKPQRLSERRPELPAGFVEVVHKAMARDRDQRFSSARELGAALEPFGAVALDATVPETTVPRPGQSSPPPVAARSEPPPTATPSTRPPGPTIGGASRSVAVEKKRGGSGRTVAVIAIAALALGAGAVVVAERASTRAHRDAPAAAITQAAQPEWAPSALPTASVALTPLPSAAALSSATSGVATAPAPSSTAPLARPARPTASAAGGPTAPASATARPSGSTRVDQRGLAGDNPFQ